jgi:hypothetical protein
MPSRRLLLATSAATLGSLAGCSQLLDDATSFEASPGSTPQSVLDETGYEERKVRDVKIQRTFEFEGQSQTVEVVNWQAEYDKAVDFNGQQARAAVFTILSTPQVDLFGKEFNPVGKMSPKELAQTVQQQYDGAKNVQSVGEETLSILDTDVSVGTFEAEATLQGLGMLVKIVFRIGKVKHGGDFVLPIAAYPKLLESTEGGPAEQLLTATEH